MADPRFLLDSNICIYVLEGTSPALRPRLEANRPGEIVTSAIVYAEVMRGIGSTEGDRLARAERLFDIFPVQPFDGRAALAYRTVPFRRGSFDRLIAAHALSLDLTLVSNNEGDFADIPGLRVENWTI
ncbi:MAG: VapC toxin family PIN domain ribonuclease [Sphingobium sp.]|nr:MAG: VapC toxin family PIN domain ribonuclease [Sphingobium sp.]